MKTKIFTLLTVLAISSFTMAQIINVPGDQPTIQAGIDVADDGDTVRIAQGTYFENISFLGKGITLASHYIDNYDTSYISNTIIDGSQPANPDSATVVYFISGEDTTSILCGFTIQNGAGTYPDAWGDRSGGGIFCENSGAKIIHNRIINNQIINYISGAIGGGIFTDTCSNRIIVVKHNTISGDTVIIGNSQTTAAYGGGAFISMPVIMQDNIIINNYAEGRTFGAGLALWHCSGTIKQNLFENNHANLTMSGYGGWGGGVYIYSPYPELKIIQNTIIGNKCIGTSVYSKAGGIGVRDGDEVGNYYIDGNTIKDNISRDGGGVCVRGTAFAHITNNIIQDNEAIDSGGGIHIFQASKDDPENNPGRGRLNSTNNQRNKTDDNMHQIVNNTITNNTSGSFGGGIANKLNGSDLVVFNNIIYDNSATQGDEIYLYNNTSTVHLYNNDIDTNLIGGNGIWAGDYNIFEDPEFDEDGYHLLPGSQCKEAGINSIEILGETFYCPELDIDSEVRPFNANADIGADELQLIVEIKESNLVNNSLLLQNSPNPFTGSTTISFVLESDGYTDLSIYDLSGKKIQTLINKQISKGVHKIKLNAMILDNGIYFCILQTNKRTQSTKIIKL